MNEPAHFPQLRGNPEWTGNFSLGGCEYYGEIMDRASFGVWLSNEPISPDEYAALQVPAEFRKSGVGRSQHDAAFFRRPPGAGTDGPLERVQVDGRWFSLVARPGAPEPGFEGVMVLPVFKSHNVLFLAGRTLEVIDTADGMALLPQATGSHLHRQRTEPAPRRMPAGWTSRHVTIADDLLVELPCPARVAIFDNGDIFHGPAAV